MSHLPSRHAPRMLRAALAAAVSLCALPALAQAAAPAVTGLSQTSVLDRGSATVTISGNGFSGATAVELIARNGSGSARPADAFTVVSDHTIKATLTPPSGFYWWVRVTNADGSSTVNTGAEFDRLISSDIKWKTSQAVRCTLGSASMTAQLVTSFEQNVVGYDPSVSVIGSQGAPLGQFHGSLVFDGSALTRGQSVRPTGSGKAKAITLGVTGAAVSSVEATSPEYESLQSTWISSSEDGNQVELPLAPYEALSVNVPTLGTPGRVVGTVRAVKVSAELSNGTTGELSCAPVVATTPIFEVEVVPAPTLSPTSGPAAGGTLVRMTGGGFTSSSAVQIDGTPVPVTVVSDKALTFVAPPHAPGPVIVDIKGRDASRTTYTYNGSSSFELTTRESAATCTGRSGATARPKVLFSAMTQRSFQTGESATITSGGLSLVFQGADAGVAGGLPNGGGPISGYGTSSVRGATATSLGFGGSQSSTSGYSADRSTYTLNYGLSISPRDLGAVTAPAGGAVTASGGTFSVRQLTNPESSVVTLTCTFDEASPLISIPVVGAPTTTPTPTPTPTPTTGPSAQFGYTLQGSTTLNTLSKGSMPLTGSVDATLALATGDLTADLALNDTQGRLTALGFLPVTATVGFATSGPTTGKLVDDQLSTTSKVRIKVKSVKAFGAIPLAGRNNCQTKSLSTIALKSTDSFDPTTRGGTLAGTYAISDLNGCGPLNGLVSPITSGGGNTITLKLTPKA